jgi:hypothetical protein
MLTISHKISYLKLIPKTGKDLTRLTNWRPITLSNCDHKIITKTYALRLGQIIGKVLKERQTAYIKGRLINDNIRAMIASINTANLEENIDGLLVSLDAKKAFDSVEHSYIEKCLRSIGMEKFIPIFNVLYKDLASDIIINGKVVKGYKILRGVKQGDSLSCILFILCMEPLLRNIEVNQRINSIRSEQFGAALPKVYAYADDLNCCFKKSNHSLQELFNEYGRLTNQSGLELNADKTEILSFRSHRGRNFAPTNFQITYLGKIYNLSSKEKVKINGIIFQQDYSRMVDDNVEAAKIRMDTHFKNWSRRSLSTLGKILIVKTFGISQLVYIMQSLTLSEKHFKAVNHIMYKFIWNRHYLAAKAPERVNRNTTNKPFLYGGFGMLDVEGLDAGLKIKAIGRLLETNHPFLAKLRDRIDFSDFFDPKCESTIEPVITRGLQLVGEDRKGLWGEEKMYANIKLISLTKEVKLVKALNATGRNSIAALNILRNGKRKIGDLNGGDIDSLAIFLDSNLVKFAKQTLNIIGRPTGEEDKLKYVIDQKFVALKDLTSKQIRLNRMDKNPINVYKSGLTIGNNQCLTWLNKARKVTSIRHKNIILRVAHKDIYTKEKLHRFGLIDNPHCPRCNLIETFEHKLMNCEYVKRIWQEIFKITNVDDSVTIDKILATSLNSSTTDITISAETLIKIMALKDDQTWLVRPRIFARNIIKGVHMLERNIKIKSDIENLLFLD